jgi:hypothetical protein
MNGRIAALPSSPMRTFTTSKPKGFSRFHEPLRAMKALFWYSEGNILPV